MHTLLEDILCEKFGERKLHNILFKKDKTKNNECIKDDNLWNLINNLREFRNSLAHHVIKNELYWQIYSWNILITPKLALSFKNSILSEKWKEMFGEFYKNKIEIYLDKLDNNFFKKNQENHFFPALYFFIINYCLKLKDN